LRFATAAVLFGLVAVCSCHEDDWVIRSCGIEVWDDKLDTMANIFKIGDCVACFKQAKRPMTEEGLEIAKMCTAKNLPVEQAACSEQIDALTLETFAESAETVQQCFKLTLKKMVASYCLSHTSSEDVIEGLTDGTICVMSMHKNITDWVHFVHQVSGIVEDEPEAPSSDIDLLQYMRYKLFPKFYCQAALKGQDEEALSSCFQCFEAAVDDNTEDQLAQLKDIIQCSENHLLPYYEDCHGGLVDLTPEVDDTPVHQCYERGVYRHVTTKCTPKAVSVNTNGLVNNIECSIAVFKSMIEENADPEIASIIIKEVFRTLP
jgi:hypothetical protein